MVGLIVYLAIVGLLAAFGLLLWLSPSRADALWRIQTSIIRRQLSTSGEQYLDRGHPSRLVGFIIFVLGVFLLVLPVAEWFGRAGRTTATRTPSRNTISTTILAAMLLFETIAAIRPGLFSRRDTSTVANGRPQSLTRALAIFLILMTSWLLIKSLY
jgi:hypothetical protein